MPETRLTKFMALSVDPRVVSSVSDEEREIPTENTQKMPEKRSTEFPALPVDPRVGFFGLPRRPIIDYCSYYCEKL